MGIQLIAMDMDGTLLRKDNTISKKTIEYLIEIQKNGVTLVLASGRSYSRLISYAKELKMDVYGGYLIEVNGVAIYDVKANKRTIRTRMPIQDAKDLFTYFTKWNVEYLGYLDRGVFDYNPTALLEEKAMYRKEHHLDENHPWTSGTFRFMDDFRSGYPDIRTITTADEIDEELNKVVITYHEEEIRTIAAIASKELKDRYWLGLTSPTWLEITMPTVTKGQGLQEISTITKIPLENMMAFGDGENDIDLLETAGLGVAMGNALDSVKAKADAITKTNEEDGILEAVKKYIGK